MSKRSYLNHLNITRLSLLTGLGLAVACGGSVTSGGDNGTAGTASGGAAGNSATGGAAGTASGGAAGASGGTAGTAGGTILCSAPVDLGNGIEQCQEGYQQRTIASSCEDKRPSYTPPEACASTVCDEALTYCAEYSDFGGPVLEVPNVGCMKGCLVDADCGDGLICSCGAPLGTCVQAACAANSDCGDNKLCIGNPESDNGCGISTIFRCMGASDICLTNADCPEGGQSCVYKEDGTAACEYPTCAIGRPFLIEGTPRLAEASGTSDWTLSSSAKLDNLKSSAAKLSAQERLSLAQHWTKLALMEHASIAAFARFSLELMALGAPSELLKQTITAMADEQRHTELCFAVARQFGADKLAASPLDISGALDTLNWQDILRNVVLEGCIGETAAALEAKLLAERAADVSLAATLHQIAEDEQRHAQLAWSFAKWCIEQHREAAISICRSAIEEELRHAESAQSSVNALSNSEQLSITEQFGYMSRSERNELKRAVLSSVVLPCLDELCQAQTA